VFEIHPNFADQWVLYDTSDGLFDAIASFYSREDAEFAREAFQKRRQSGGQFAERAKPLSRWN
jgi:hypothetical protein